MDNTWKQRLTDEASSLGVALDPIQVDALASHADMLLRWNAKLNLTRITDPDEVRVKHVLDSLCALQLVPEGAWTVLDLGTGAGFPGIPWLVARPKLQATLVDSVGKKIHFVRMALAQLGLSRGRAIHARLAGALSAEGLHTVDVVVSRAVASLSDVLKLAPAYLAPLGSVVAMLGPREGLERATELATSEGFDVVASLTFALPGGRGERVALRLVPRETVRSTGR